MTNNKEIYIEGVNGTMKDCRFPLPNKAICLGTDAKSCAIIYPSTVKGISLVHCQILPQSHGYIIVDFSESGTWLNGEKMTRGQGFPLKDGDRFSLGGDVDSFVFRETVKNASAENFEQPTTNGADYPNTDDTPDVTQAGSPDDVTQEETHEITSDEFLPPIIEEERWHENGIKDKFFTSKGRVNRKRYFLRGLLLGVIATIVSIPIHVANVYENSGYRVDDTLEIFALLSGILVFLIYIPMWFNIIRRCHDIDKSGWWSLLMLVPFVNIVFGLYILFKKGTAGRNRFGPDPLAQ